MVAGRYLRAKLIQSISHQLLNVFLLEGVHRVWFATG